MREDLPAGTVTFLFTDVEGSTRLLLELGPEGYARALDEHRRIVRKAVRAHAGVEVDTQGDSFFVAFPTVPGAVTAALQIQDDLAAGHVRVRMGLHTGTPLVTREGYVGVDVNRAARIAAAGHGGQVLLSSASAALANMPLRDLGEHRLKDLGAPERLYQLGADDHPPLRSLYRTTLPVPATPFVGRDDEVSMLADSLRKARGGVLTLTGPGGTGKTRLALQAAAESAEGYPDGVWWVPLAPLRDSELGLLQIMRSVGIRENENEPPLQAVAARFSGSRALLLLDNAEHLLPRIASDIAALVAACPSVTLLVTSRERLNIGAEQTVPVLPLKERDAIDLFLSRARAVDPTFEESPTVAELCTRLDELPLAIELAAARASLFTPRQLLSRLAEKLDLLTGARDSDPRQQTLRATMSWSYDLLSDDERRLFSKLSVFSGGFTLDAAEKVCEANATLVQSLLDKSLVRRRLEADGEPRYWMLEIVREFGAERLAEAGEGEAAARRHGLYYLALVETDEVALGAEEHRSWLEQIGREHGNLHAALTDARRRRDIDLAYRLTKALLPYWRVRGEFEEASRAATATLAFESDDARLRAWVLLAAGAVERSRGAYPTALRMHEEALSLLSADGDTYGVAHATSHLAVDRVLIDPEPDEAAALAERALELRRGFGEVEAAQGLHTLGLVRMVGGHLEAAQATFEESLEACRRLGLLRSECVALSTLAQTALLRARPAEARDHYIELLDRDRELGDRYVIGIALDGLAIVGASAGAYESAARLWGAAAGIYEETGGRPLPYIAEIRSTAVAAARAALAERYGDLFGEGGSLELEEVLAEAVEVPAPRSSAGAATSGTN